MGEVDAARFGEAIDLLVEAGRVGRLAALQAVDHPQQHAVAHAVGVHLQRVHAEAAHDAVDHAEAGNDDVDAIGVEARDFAALLGRHLGEAVDEVPHVGARDAGAGGGEPRQAAARHDDAGEVGERAAGADEVMQAARRACRWSCGARGR